MRERETGSVRPPVGFGVRQHEVVDALLGEIHGATVRLTEKRHVWRDGTAISSVFRETSEDGWLRRVDCVPTGSTRIERST